MNRSAIAPFCSLLFASFLSVAVSPANAAQQPQPLPAQPRPAPKAKSKEEFEAFQKFSREPNPDEQIRLIEDFLLQYPDTSLKEYAFQEAMQAYQIKNDYEKVLTYGELTLNENPDNLVALLVLASAIPERTTRDEADRDEKLQDAEQYADRGMDVLAKLPKPPNIAQEIWERTKKETESTAHAALGMVALIREDFSKAEEELKEAVGLASKPDPLVLYRLGLSYSFDKKYDQALTALDRASSSGGVKIKAADGGTRDLVREAIDFSLKAKAEAVASDRDNDKSPGAVSPRAVSKVP